MKNYPLKTRPRRMSLFFQIHPQIHLQTIQNDTDFFFVVPHIDILLLLLCPLTLAPVYGRWSAELALVSSVLPFKWDTQLAFSTALTDGKALSYLPSMAWISPLWLVMQAWAVMAQHTSDMLTPYSKSRLTVIFHHTVSVITPVLVTHHITASWIMAYSLQEAKYFLIFIRRYPWDCFCWEKSIKPGLQHKFPWIFHKGHPGWSWLTLFPSELLMEQKAGNSHKEILSCEHWPLLLFDTVVFHTNSR